MTFRLNHGHMLKYDAPLGRFRKVVLAEMFDFASFMLWIDFAETNNILLSSESNSPLKTFSNASNTNPPNRKTGCIYTRSAR